MAIATGNMTILSFHDERLKWYNRNESLIGMEHAENGDVEAVGNSF